MTVFSIYTNIINIIFWICYLLTVPRMLHIMQQESYQNDGMLRWIAKNPGKAFKRTGIIMLITILFFFLPTLLLSIILPKIEDESTRQIFAKSFSAFVSSGALFISLIILFIKEHKERKNAKKPLKYTARAKRLMAYNIVVVILIQVLICQSFSTFYPKEIQQNMSSYNAIKRVSALSSGDADYEEKFKEIENDYLYANIYDEEKQFMYLPLVMAFMVFTLPLNMIIANWFASPLERKFAERYMQKAYRKLHGEDYKNLIKIGITGSYGKTSTKYILKTILEEKYKVLATPGSYNTSMGNVKIIREELKPEHQVFISEMGARKKGDIQEICGFVEPHIGIITSIGEQHLETFKTIQNVAKTKAELLAGTGGRTRTANYYDSVIGMTKAMLNVAKETVKGAKKEDFNKVLDEGAVFLYKDGDLCEDLFNKDKHKNKFSFSADDDKASYYAKDIKVGPEGSEFTVVSPIYHEYKCKTKLLGKHNVQNIIGAIAIAEFLGLTKAEIESGVAKIEPVEHRLQILPSNNGTTVIDDAFNSNPIGSKAALDVIKEFPGRKIIITPGMVELGEREEALNKDFGRQMADAVDIAILVGPNHTKPIQEGLKAKNFDDMSIYVVKDLNEATERLQKIAQPGDVILFENDLPDSYNE